MPRIGRRAREALRANPLATRLRRFSICLAWDLASGTISPAARPRSSVPVAESPDPVEHHARAAGDPEHVAPPARPFFAPHRLGKVDPERNQQRPAGAVNDRYEGGYRNKKDAKSKAAKPPC